MPDAADFGLICSFEPYVRFAGGLMAKMCPCGREHDGQSGVVVEVTEGPEIGHRILYHPECLGEVKHEYRRD